VRNVQFDSDSAFVMSFQCVVLQLQGRNAPGVEGLKLNSANF